MNQFCKNAGPLTFLLYDLERMLISFLNDVDIQLILEFKAVFENNEKNVLCILKTL